LLINFELLCPAYKALRSPFAVVILIIILLCKIFAHLVDVYFLSIG
jgi:hypothetical protein